MKQLHTTPRCLDAIDGVIYRRRLDKPSTVELPGNLQRSADRSIELIAQGQRPDGQIARLQLQPSTLDDSQTLRAAPSCALPVDFVQSLADDAELKLVITVDGLEHASTSLRISDKEDPPSSRFYPPLLTKTHETATTISLVWTPVIGAFDYQVDVSIDGVSTKYDTKWLFMELKKSDLPVNRTCTIRVRARLAWWFYTDYSNSLWLNTPIDRRIPKNLSVMVASAGQAKIVWEAPDEAGPIDGYKVSLLNGETYVTSALTYSYVLPAGVDEARVGIVRGNNYMYNAIVKLQYHDKEPPARPKNFKYAMYSATAATISWEANDNIGTQLYSFIREGISNGLIGKPELDITGIEEGHHDSVEVIAIDAAGNRSLPGRAELSAKWYPPEMPILGEIVPDYDCITLNWNAQPHVTFEVTYYVAPDGDKQVVTTGKNTIFLDDVTGGVTFTFEVRAISQNGLRSDPASATKTIPREPVPAKPVITVSKAGNFGVQFAYETADADSYTIRHWLHNTDTVISAVTWEPQYTLKPLITGATYTIEITAFNESGASPMASHTLTMDELTSELKPSVSVLNNEDNSITLGWMTNYEYNAIEMIYGTRDQPEIGRFITMDGYHEFTDLTPNTQYVFEVRRSNQLGISPSQFISITTGNLDPLTPRDLRIVSPPQATHRSLTWTLPEAGTPPVQFVSDGEGINIISPYATSHTFAVASPEYEHLSSVTADWGTVLYSASVLLRRTDPVPLQPQVSAVCMGFDYVTLKWHGETGVEYEAFCRSNNPSVLPSIKTPYNYCTFTDLIPGTTYTFDVHASKNGVTSEPGTLSVRMYDLPRPDASTISQVSHGIDNMTLSFPTRYADDYLIICNTAGGEPLSVTTAQSTYRFEQLRPHTVYDFQITARNAVGDAETAIFSGTTDSIAPTVQVVLDAPTLDVAWHSPSADLYELTWGVVNGETVGPTELTETSLRIENWVNGATYWFNVRAKMSSIDYWSEVTELRHTQKAVTTPTIEVHIVNGTLVMRWASENADEYSYYWRVGDQPIVGPFSTPLKEHWFVAPQPAQTYWVRVCAHKVANNTWSDWSDISHTMP